MQPRRTAARCSRLRTTPRVPRRDCGRATPAFRPCPPPTSRCPATWLVFDHFTHSLTVWACGESDDAIERRIDGCIERLYAAPPVPARLVRAVSPMTQSIERDRYLDLASGVQRRIYEGDVYQLQLGIRFGAKLDGTAFDLYRALRRRNPSPYMFYVDTPFGQLLGASPEFLVRLDGRKARIRPLAGTRSRGADDAEDAAIAGRAAGRRKRTRRTRDAGGSRP